MSARETQQERRKRIARLKKEVDDGTYVADPVAVADGLLESGDLGEATERIPVGKDVDVDTSEGEAADGEAEGEDTERLAKAAAPKDAETETEGTDS